jgi:membrane-associated phospholipid phosphatase
MHAGAFRFVRSLWVHEAAFMVVFAVTFLRATLSGEVGWSMLAATAGLPAVLAAIVAWHDARPSVARFRLRLAAYPVALCAGYLVMQYVATPIGFQDAEALLRDADRKLGLESIRRLLADLEHPVLSDLLSVCYMLLIPYGVATWVRYLVMPPEIARAFYRGAFTMFAIGLLGYSLLPAGGPYLGGAGVAPSLPSGGLLTELNYRYIAFSNRVDCFPSLHVAASLYYLLADYRVQRWRFWAWLPLVAGLWAATLYFGFHYVIDLVAGIALAWGCWRILPISARQSGVAPQCQ